MHVKFQLLRLQIQLEGQLCEPVLLAHTVSLSLTRNTCTSNTTRTHNSTCTRNATHTCNAPHACNLTTTCSSSTVGSQLSELRLSVSECLDVAMFSAAEGKRRSGHWSAVIGESKAAV